MYQRDAHSGQGLLARPVRLADDARQGGGGGTAEVVAGALVSRLQANLRDGLRRLWLAALVADLHVGPPIAGPVQRRHGVLARVQPGEAITAILVGRRGPLDI